MSPFRALAPYFLSATLVIGLTPLPGLAQQRSQNSPSARARARDLAPTAKPVNGERNAKVPTTLVTLELLTGADASALKSHEWAKQCEALGITCTIRRGREDDEPGVSEKSRGGAFRQVAVVGRLDNRGRIVFPDRAFAPGEVKRLAEWLDELKSYGAQGSPEGQRVWGLAKDQFGSVFESLMPRVEFETMDAPLGEILDHFKFSPKHPLKFTVGANNRLGETGRSEICTQSLRGIAQGTALSLILAERGLGMKPRRNPDGSIDLAIYDLQEAKNVWPVGWYQGNTPGKTAPSLFVFKEIHFDDVDVDSVLSASAEVTGVPVLIDRTNLKSKEIEFADIPVDFPLKKTTWAQAYDRILGKAGCKYELLNDESGRPFVWVTTLQTPSRKPQ